MNNAKVLFTLPWFMLNRMQYREGLLRIQCKLHCHAILEEKKEANQGRTPCRDYACQIRRPHAGPRSLEGYGRLLSKEVEEDLRVVLWLPLKTLRLSFNLAVRA